MEDLSTQIQKIIDDKFKALISDLNVGETESLLANKFEKSFMSNLSGNDNLPHYIFRQYIRRFKPSGMVDDETIRQAVLSIGALGVVILKSDESLPDVGATNTFYFVQSAETDGTVIQDIYEEYIWVKDHYEKIGKRQIDLKSYYTKKDTDILLDKKVDKEEGKLLSTNDFSTEEKEKLGALHNYDDSDIKKAILKKLSGANVQSIVNYDVQLNSYNRIANNEVANKSRFGLNENNVGTYYGDAIAITYGEHSIDIVFSTITQFQQGNQYMYIAYTDLLKNLSEIKFGTVYNAAVSFLIEIPDDIRSLVTYTFNNANGVNCINSSNLPNGQYTLHIEWINSEGADSECSNGQLAFSQESAKFYLKGENGFSELFSLNDVENNFAVRRGDSFYHKENGKLKKDFSIINEEDDVNGNSYSPISHKYLNDVWWKNRYANLSNTFAQINNVYSKSDTLSRTELNNEFYKLLESTGSVIVISTSTKQVSVNFNNYSTLSAIQTYAYMLKKDFTASPIIEYSLGSLLINKLTSCNKNKMIVTIIPDTYETANSFSFKVFNLDTFTYTDESGTQTVLSVNQYVRGGKTVTSTDGAISIANSMYKISSGGLITVQLPKDSTSGYAIGTVTIEAEINVTRCYVNSVMSYNVDIIWNID